MAGAAASIAGCFGRNTGSGFTRTDVEAQELVVEFDEGLGPDQISVVDPDGEGYAETSVAAGVTQASFEISMPYTPGEYTIIATQDGEEVAETSLEIAPELKILDVGVGANRMNEMPEELGNTRESEALIEVENSGTGPEVILHLNLLGYLPNDRGRLEEKTGVFDPETGREASSSVLFEGNDNQILYTSTVPFSFNGDGVKCEEEPQSGEFTIELDAEIRDFYTQEYHINYTSAQSYDGCEIEISERE